MWKVTAQVIAMDIIWGITITIKRGIIGRQWHL